MSFKLTAQAYNNPTLLALGLNEHALGVYRALCNASNGNTGRCDPATDTIAAELAVSVRTVERALRDLRAAGLIATGQKHDRRGYVSGLSFTVLTVPQTVRQPEPDRLTDGAGTDSQTEPGPTDRRSNKNLELNLEEEPGESAREPQPHASESTALALSGATASTSDDERPSPFCKRHPRGTDDPCRPCGTARTRLSEWEIAHPEQVQLLKRALQPHKSGHDERAARIRQMGKELKAIDDARAAQQAVDVGEVFAFEPKGIDQL